MEKIWLKSYPKGVPAEIDVNEYASVRDVFEESVAKYATRPAFSCMGKSLTFAELDTLSAAFGAWLQGMGCKKGTRVALMMPNILQYPVCLFGTLRAGLHGGQRQSALHAARARAPVERFGRRGDRLRREFRAVSSRRCDGKTKVRQTVVTSIGELLGFKGLLVDFVLRHVKKMVPAFSLPGSIRLSDALDDGRKRTLEHVPIGHDDIAFLQYTGGTTGVAKGAMLLHRNIVANLLQARAWVQPFLGDQRAKSSSRRCRCTTSSRSPRTASCS